MSADLGWLTPHSIKSEGTWPFRKHQVMFEDTPVVFSTSDHEIASRVVDALNGAYNLGRASRALEVENDA